MLTFKRQRVTRAALLDAMRRALSFCEGAAFEPNPGAAWAAAVAVAGCGDLRLGRRAVRKLEAHGLVRVYGARVWLTDRGLEVLRARDGEG